MTSDERRNPTEIIVPRECAAGSNASVEADALLEQRKIMWLHVCKKLDLGEVAAALYTLLSSVNDTAVQSSLLQHLLTEVDCVSKLDVPQEFVLEQKSIESDLSEFLSDPMGFLGVYGVELNDAARLIAPPAVKKDSDPWRREFVQRVEKKIDAILEAFWGKLSDKNLVDAASRKDTLDHCIEQFRQMVFVDVKTKFGTTAPETVSEAHLGAQCLRRLLNDTRVPLVPVDQDVDFLKEGKFSDDDFALYRELSRNLAARLRATKHAPLVKQRTQTTGRLLQLLELMNESEAFLGRLATCGLKPTKEVQDKVKMVSLVLAADYIAQEADLGKLARLLRDKK